jgi:EAL domain-containing protein (putative c-di-GMP-specific phosphodiesterase class I)/GGDEF domain-containing protein
MNLMSGEVEALVAHLNARLEALGERLQRDPVTGLFGEARLESDLEHWLADGRTGSVVVLRIENLGGIANRLGPTETNRFLRDLANQLTEVARAWHREAGAYRRQGSALALLLPDLDVAAAESYARTLVPSLIEAGRAVGQEDLVHLGFAPFNPYGTSTGVLAAASDACAQAQLIGPNAWVIRRDREQGRGDDEWHRLIARILAEQSYQVEYIDPVRDLKQDGILMEEAFIRVADESGQPLPVGALISMAEKLGSIAALDQGMTRLVLARLRESGVTHSILINLSLTTLGNADFRHGLTSLLREQPALARQLIFGVSAYSAGKNPSLIREMGGLLRHHGASLLIKRYEPRFITTETLRELRPDTIRLARDLTAGISREAAKRALVEALLELGAMLEIRVIAERVADESDLSLLREMGLAGASR